jgi:CRISP-associated protein Cas1
MPATKTAKTVHPMLDSEAWNAANEDASLMIADGKSVTVQVHSGVLVVTDGPMGSKRTRKLARVPRKVKHLAILTDHGYISLDAMAWMDNVEMTWEIIDRSGRVPRVLGTSGHMVNPHLMRRQAMCAPGMPGAFTGVKIWRLLITQKLQGQAENAERIFGDLATAEFIREQIVNVQTARCIDTIRGFEGTAAERYWNAWHGMTVNWKRPGPVQPHWLAFPSRSSLRYDWETNRNATDPVNAMLNFAYYCAETECTLAIQAAAMAPQLGVGHVDRATRNSFSLDLIEVMRPAVDAIIVRILTEPLDKRWFRETSTGTVICCAPLTHRLLSEVHGEVWRIARALIGVTALLDATKRPSRKASLAGSQSSV